MSSLQQLERALVSALSSARPTVPEAGVLLWNLFMQIGATRTWHSAGPHPIGFSEIEAFCRLHRWPLQPHHIAIIRALDDAWLEHAYRKMEGGKGNSRTFDCRCPANAQPMTAAAFDAVFG